MIRQRANNIGKFGAGEGIRTLDPNLGKVVLQLQRRGTLREAQSIMLEKSLAAVENRSQRSSALKLHFLSAITNVGLDVKSVTYNPISWAFHGRDREPIKLTS
jgi:hypothetical protein